jgi:hypothetical protein
MNVVSRPFLPHDERISPLATLAWVGRAQYFAKRHGTAAAERFLIENRAGSQAVEIFKSPVGATSTLDSVFGPDLITIGAWADALRTTSVFYKLLAQGDLLLLPFNARVSLKTSWPTAAAIPEGAAIPVGRDVFNNVLLSPQKCAVQMVCTAELMMRVDAEGQRLFNSQLAGLTSEKADAMFISAITAGLTPVVSAGATAVNAHHDLRTMGLTVKKVGLARPYFACGEDVAWMASTLADSAGSRAFPQMTPSGGTMDGVETLVGTGIPAGQIVLFDARQIAANGTAPVADTSRVSDYQADSAPTQSSATPTSSTMVSAFQTDGVVFRAVGWLGAVRIRNTAVNVMTGINWG